MKTILYMAVSVDGFIAGADGGTGWVSQNDWRMWNSVGKKCGSIIIGRKTYEGMLRAGELPLDGRVVFVTG